MVFSMLVFYFARPPLAWWVRWVGIAGALCLLVLSRSATGIVVSAIMVATLPLLPAASLQTYCGDSYHALLLVLPPSDRASCSTRFCLRCSECSIGLQP